MKYKIKKCKKLKSGDVIIYNFKKLKIRNITQGRGVSNEFGEYMAINFDPSDPIHKCIWCFENCPVIVVKDK